MNKKIIAFLIIPLVLIFSMVTLSFGQFIPNAPFKSDKVIAPDFSLKDLQGKTFKLSKYSGKPVLLFFGTTWCPSCRAEIPAYKNIYATYSQKRSGSRLHRYNGTGGESGTFCQDQFTPLQGVD